MQKKVEVSVRFENFRGPSEIGRNLKVTSYINSRGNGETLGRSIRVIYDSAKRVTSL